MADQNETSAPVDVVVTAVPNEVPAPKKQRAPRRSKAEIEAAATVKSPRVRQKAVAKAAAVPVSAGVPSAAAAKKIAVRGGPTKAKPVRQAPAPTAPAGASDEMADLLQLEEDNKKLRQALADKLRAENADLRKRLGA